MLPIVGSFGQADQQAVKLELPSEAYEIGG
jgi:hypothetical protein